MPPSPLGVFSALRLALAIYRRRFGLFLGLMLIPMVVAFVLAFIAALVIVGAALALTDGGPEASGGLLAGAAIVAIVVVLLIALVLLAVTVKTNGMLVRLAAETERGAWPTFGDLHRATKGIVRRGLLLIVLFTVLATAWYVLALVALASTLGSVFNTGEMAAASGGAIALFGLFLLASLVGALFLGVKWIYYGQALALENAGGLEPLRRSWRLTTGHFWRTLGWLLLVGVLVLAVYLVVMGPLSLVTGVSPIGMNPALDPAGQAAVGAGGLAGALSSLVSTVLSLLISPFVVIFYTVMYLDQRRRKGETITGVAAGASSAPQYETRPHGETPADRLGRSGGSYGSPPSGERPATPRYGQYGPPPTGDAPWNQPGGSRGAAWPSPPAQGHDRPQPPPHRGENPPAP